MSDIKQASNRANSRKSTGPKSVAGKQKVSQNAKQYGILSTHLVLENESREEFDFLLATLQQEMEPNGLLENTLFERLAVAMWRQRRLVRAESAELELRERSLHGKDLLVIASSIGLLPGDRRLRMLQTFRLRKRLMAS